MKLPTRVYPLFRHTETKPFTLTFSSPDVSFENLQWLLYMFPAQNGGQIPGWIIILTIQMAINVQHKLLKVAATCQKKIDRNYRGGDLVIIPNKWE